jgi:hypothetical protein
MDKSVGPTANAQAEVIFEMTIPGNCIDTGVNKVSSDLEENSRVYSPNALTSNVFEGGSKRSRHSAPKGTSEEEWANMSRQQHKDWRALHPKSANRKAAMENPRALQSLNDHLEQPQRLAKPDQWSLMSDNQKKKWLKKARSK